VGLTEQEKHTATLLTEALTDLAERVVGVEPCGCGAPSVGVSLDVTKVRVIGGKVHLPPHFVLCAACSARQTQGGDG